MLIHSRLIGYDRAGNLAGELAESFGHEADDAWVFRLVPNAVFHNGEPVTSADVRHTIEQIGGERSTAYMRAQFQSVSRIETPDARTIRIYTKEPVATLPTWFGNYNMPIVWRGSPANEPVGCGAYRLETQERGTSLDLVAFDRYFRAGLPRIERHTVEAETAAARWTLGRTIAEHDRDAVWCASDDVRLTAGVFHGLQRHDRTGIGFETDAHFAPFDAHMAVRVRLEAML
jgi:MarR-like DNA-binding transcriptional regulator SgrR of sgrS sRNA